MLLFYDTQIKIETQNFIFQRSDSNHIKKVLRKKSGDEIKITDGKGLEWTGKLTVITPQKTCAEKIKVFKHYKYNPILLSISGETSRNDKK